MSGGRPNGMLKEEWDALIYNGMTEMHGVAMRIGSVWKVLDPKDLCIYDAADDGLTWHDDEGAHLVRLADRTYPENGANG